ncbi:MAG: CotH kinase family protein, partial [Planctomycetes bacterium]|nr:CotH kinase family protein [Planctomycetota bacterium]
YRQDNRHGQAWDASDDSQKAPVTEIRYRGTFRSAESELHLVLPRRGIVLVDDVTLTTETTQTTTSDVLIDRGTTWRFAKGETAPPPAWNSLAFDDRSWLSGDAVVGFGYGDEATVLTDMRGRYHSVFFRATFDVPDPDAINDLFLEIDSDEGYVAYLNGKEVLRENLSDGPVTHLTTATTALGRSRTTRDLTRHKQLIRKGANVLGIQVHNVDRLNPTFRFDAALIDGEFSTVRSPNLVTDGDFDTGMVNVNWTIQGTHSRSGRTETTPLSGSGSLKVIATGNGDNKVNRIETSDAGLTPLVSGQEYEIALRARWIVGSPSLLTHGAYDGPLHASYAAAHTLALPERFGTPGTANSASARRNSGPLIYDVAHTPASPAANQVVTISAYASSPESIARMRLYYSLERAAALDSERLRVVPMQDCGDGHFTAVVPGHTLHTTVVFFILATDMNGYVGRFPRDVTADTHPLTLAPQISTPGDNNYAMYEHVDPFTGLLHSYRAVLSQDSKERLDSRLLESNEALDATFVFNDRDIYYNAKVRFTGSPFARKRWNGSWRVRMPADRPLHGEFKQLQLEDHGTDGRERLSNYLLRFNQGSTRVPYSRHRLVQWQVGDRLDAVRDHVERPTRSFLERWYDGSDHGALFEMNNRHNIDDTGERTNSLDAHLRFPPYGPLEEGEDKENYRYYFNPRGGNPYDSFASLLDLAHTMTPAATSNEEFDALIWETIEVEQFLRVWAIRLNTDDWDSGGARRGKNCYFYQIPDSAKWVMLAWDMELTYDNPLSFRPPAIAPGTNHDYNLLTFPEIFRLINRPRIKRLYYSILQELVDGPFRSDFLEPYLRTLKKTGITNLEAGLPGGFIDTRREILEEALSGARAPAVEFRVVTDRSGSITSELNEVRIEGVAPIEVREIRIEINGVQSDAFSVRFSDHDVFGWIALGDVPSGLSTLTFLGSDAAGELVATTSVAIEVAPPTTAFLRGDSNLSNRLEVSDAIVTLRHLFAGAQIICADAADTNDDGDL